MILLSAPSQQIVLVLLKHFTLIWTDCKTHTLYESKMSKSVNCACWIISVKLSLKLIHFDRIVSWYQTPLIKPNKFYLDFAPINKEFQSNVNNHVNSMNPEIHVHVPIIYQFTWMLTRNERCISECKFTSP